MRFGFGWAATVGVVSLLGACGIGLTGASEETQPDAGNTTLPDGSSSANDGSNPPVAESDGSTPAPPIDAGDACSKDACGFTVPPNWALVAFGSGAALAPCPTGFVSNAAIMNPVAGAGACACSASSCNITTTPSCSTGSINTTYDSTGTPTCNQTGIDLSVNGGACRNFSGTFGQHTGVGTTQPSGAGSCTAPAVANAGALTSTPVRVCTNASCAAVCDPGLAVTGFERCLFTSGDQTCPSDAPTKHLIGTKATLGCGTCATCSVTVASCSGQMVFYSNQNCGTAVRTFTSGVCGNGNASYQSYRWTGTANGVQCNPSGPPAPNVLIEGQSTVCCK